jgi:dTDP-4-amino-4,6-dideoxygalactose transaminase
MTHTESLAARLLRVPLWVGMTEDDVARVADRLERALRVAV